MKVMSDTCMHGGDIRGASKKFGVEESSLTDFSSNVNVFGLSPAAVKAVRGSIRNIAVYPDRRCSGLIKALSGYLGIKERHIVAGNGSADILYRLVPALNIRRGVVVLPSFGEYAKALTESGAKVIPFFAKEKYGFLPDVKEILGSIPSSADSVFLCNPNNPTGALMRKRDVKFLAAALRRRKVLLVLDEAFIDLAAGGSLAGVAAENSNLLVLRSMTKFFALAGLRLGYAVGSAAIIKRLRDFGQPWPVNIMAQAAGEAILRDKDFCGSNKKKLLDERGLLYERLRGIEGIMPFPSQANFIMVKIENGMPSGQLQKELARRGMLIRDCADFAGLGDKYFRIAVRGRADNLLLVRHLGAVLRRQ